MGFGWLPACKNKPSSPEAQIRNTEVSMLFAALVLLLGVPQNDETAKAVSAPPSVIAGKTEKDSVAKDSPRAALPSMPEPKAAPKEETTSLSGAAFPATPVRPAVMAIQETPTQRKIWYGLAAAGHAGAAFDAWSTRRAIRAGAGTEANPMLRPFAHSGALYAATQASPLLMDYLGKKMMTSQHKWVRKMWWLPQTAGASMSFAAGAHNTALVQ